MLSSVGRQPDRHGKSTYGGLTLASFKESGDIEYAADDAFILTPADDTGIAVLWHAKARHTEPADIPLRAELGYMRFDPLTADPPGGDGSGLLDRARKLWRTGHRRGIPDEYRPAVGRRQAPARVRRDPPDRRPGV